MDKKRIIYILVFTVVCVLLGTAMYYVFFRKPTAPAVKPRKAGTVPVGQEFPGAGTGGTRTSTSAGGGVIPTSGVSQLGGSGQAGLGRTPSRVRPLVTENILAASADASGNGAKFYSKSDGKFYRIKNDGSVEAMSNDVFYNVDNVTWSPVSDESIIEYPDGANIYYNFNTKKQVTLPKHWEDFSFDPTGGKIAAKNMTIAPENRWLITSNPDGNETKLVEPMGEFADKVTVDWSPNKQVVALSRTGEPLGGDRQEILFIGQNGENFRSTVVEGRDFRSAWSPEGQKLLYSVYSERNDFKPELWIVGAEGDNIGNGRKYLNLNTWADKCTFSNERYVFCGVPETLETGAGFAPEISNETRDKLIKIDLQTGARTEIRTDENYVVNSMFVSKDGKTLFFTDKRKDGLFSAPL